MKQDAMNSAPVLSDRRMRLGPSGPQLLPLGVGTWAWGDRLVWGRGPGDGDPQPGGRMEADLRGAFRAALAAGVSLFDTAEIYGNGRSERLLGQFLRDGPAAQPVVVATKFMPFPWRLRRADLLRALQGSLRRLGLARVDLYQIHWPYPPVPIGAWMDAMAEAVAEGLVGAVGVSNFSARQMRAAHDALARRGVPLASNQVHYSLLHRQPERDGVLDTCQELGVVLIAYSPLEMGLLTGKYGPAQRPGGLRRWRYGPRHLARLSGLIGLMREIGRGHGGRTPTQVALNWLVAKGTLPIPGARNAAQARENAESLAFEMTSDEMAALEQAGAALEGDGMWHG